LFPILLFFLAVGPNPSLGWYVPLAFLVQTPEFFGLFPVYLFPRSSFFFWLSDFFLVVTLPSHSLFLFFVNHGFLEGSQRPTVMVRLFRIPVAFSFFPSAVFLSNASQVCGSLFFSGFAPPLPLYLLSPKLFFFPPVCLAVGHTPSSFPPSFPVFFFLLPPNPPLETPTKGRGAFFFSWSLVGSR